MIKVLPGDQFGKLIVIKEVEKIYQPSGQFQRGFLCACECGNEKIIRLSHLRTGRVSSCGCIMREQHGDVGTKLHNSWRAMQNRCKSNYFQRQYYFDKGISVWVGWKKYTKFKEWALRNGYKEGLQLDRVDNSKGYNPGNCRFVTQEVNLANRDKTKKVTFQGKEWAFAELLRENGNLNNTTIDNRIKRGWSVEDAILIPVRKGRYRKKRDI